MPVPANIQALADDARIINDDDEGSERQVDASLAFFDVIEKLFPDDFSIDREEETLFQVYCFKATPDEIIDEALRITAARIDNKDPYTGIWFYDSVRAGRGVPSILKAPEVDLEPEFEPLVELYTQWLKAEGLDLGSADEHRFDEDLTQQQRDWIAAYCEIWDLTMDFHSDRRKAKREEHTV